MSTRPSRTSFAVVSTIAAAGLVAAVIAANASAASVPFDPEHLQIVGGVKASSPWVVQLEGRSAGGGFGCSGSLIAPTWVLTAKHCMEDADSIDVYFDNSTSAKGQPVKVTAMKAAPQGDVALLQLSSPKQAAQFAPLGAPYTPQAGDKAQIAGYGLRAAKGEPDYLYGARVTVLGSSQDAYGGKAVHIKGRDGASNHGDSGGPLWVKGRVVGVCSTGDSSDPGSDIASGSNYAQIDQARDWIKQTAGV